MFEKKDKEFKSYELHEFVYGVVSAISQAKSQVDHSILKQRDRLEEEFGKGFGYHPETGEVMLGEK